MYTYTVWIGDMHPEVGIIFEWSCYCCIPMCMTYIITIMIEPELSELVAASSTLTGELYNFPCGRMLFHTQERTCPFFILLLTSE